MSGLCYDFLFKFFRLVLPKSLVGGPSLIHKLSGIESFREKRRGGREGVSRFSVKIFSSRITEKLRRGNLLCFTNFLVSKILWKTGGEGGRKYQDFQSKFFIQASTNFMLERVMSRFSIQIFSSRITEKFSRRPFCISQTFWYRNNIKEKRREGKHEGLSKISVGNVLSQCRKTS